MEIALALVGSVTPVLYGIASVAYLSLFLRDDGFSRRAAPPLLMAALAVHFVELLLRGLSLGMLPIGNVFQSLSGFAFAVAAVYLYIETRQKTPMTGIFVMPFVFLAEIVSSAFIDRSGPPPAILRSALLGLHTGAAILGYCAFAVAAIYGVLFLALYHELKLRRFSLVYRRLPPLDALAQMNIRALAVGFAFLSASIVFGAVWVREISASLGDPKIFLTVLAWAVFGLSILAHFVLGWRGPRVIYITVLGFLFLVSSSIAVNLVGGSFHVFR